MEKAHEPRKRRFRIEPRAAQATEESTLPHLRDGRRGAEEPPPSRGKFSALAPVFPGVKSRSSSQKLQPRVQAKFPQVLHLHRLGLNRYTGLFSDRLVSTGTQGYSVIDSFHPHAQVFSSI